jgi:hypothetical protein
MVPIPYYPGYESLMPTGGMAEAEVDDRKIVHPLADGAEAYYFYERGDSLTIRLPNNTVVPLRELRNRPRRPSWQTIVGSFWFDTRSGQLVRAAYRLSFLSMCDGDRGRKIRRPPTTSLVRSKASSLQSRRSSRRLPSNTRCTTDASGCRDSRRSRDRDR